MKHLTPLILALTLFLAGFQARAQEVPSALVDAVTLYGNGHFNEAKTLLDALYKRYPNDDAVCYYYGMTQAELGDTDTALTLLNKALAIDSGNVSYREALAAIYGMKGELDLVAEMYEAILKSNPARTDLQLKLMDIYIREKQYEKALAALDAIEENEGQNEQISGTRYDILQTLGRDEEALKALEDYNANFSSPVILTTIGDYHLAQYHDSLAMAAYDEALSLKSDYVPALLGRSEVFRITRRYPEYFGTLRPFVGEEGIPAASKAMYIDNVTRSLDPKFISSHRADYDSLLTETLRIHPADSTVLVSAGAYYFRTDRKQEAKELFVKNSDLYPGSISAAAMASDLLYRMEDWEGLKERASKGAELFPEEGAFLEYNTVALYNLKDYEGVIRLEKTILERFPNDTSMVLRAWSTIGDMEYQLGNEKAAFKAYDKALKINKDYTPVLNNYAWYLSKGGKKLKKAEQMSRRTIELEPDNATFLDTFGWILHLQGKDLEAKPFFKHGMLYGGKENTVMLCHYAEVLYKLGEYDLAKVYWDMAIKRNNGEVLNLEEKVKEKLEKVGK